MTGLGANSYGKSEIRLVKVTRHPDRHELCDAFIDSAAALGMSAIASFIAGTFGVIVVTLLSPTLANFALRFGPPEYFALILLGFTAIGAVAGSSLAKGLTSVAFGLLLSTIGLDIMSGRPRFTFGEDWLLSGFDFVVVAIGVFGAFDEWHQELFNRTPDFVDWIADMIGAERAYTAAIELMQLPPGANRVVGLADAIHDLAAQFDISPDDLNLDLGPIGRLM